MPLTTHIAPDRRDVPMAIADLPARIRGALRPLPTPPAPVPAPPLVPADRDDPAFMAFGLERDDRERLCRFSEAVAFEPGQGIQGASLQTTHCYFLRSGLASATCDDQRGIEVATVLAPDFVGLGILLGSPVTLYPIHAVTGVSALRIEVGAFRAALDASPALRRSMLLHADRVVSKLHRRATCSALHGVDERLASWILLHSHAGKGPVRLTHDALAKLLGVRRATVTLALHHIESKRAISAHRTCVEVRSRALLRECACACHGLP